MWEAGQSEGHVLEPQEQEGPSVRSCNSGESLPCTAERECGDIAHVGDGSRSIVALVP